MTLEKLARFIYESSYQTAPKLMLQFVDFETLIITKPIEPTNLDLMRFKDREVRDYYFKIIDNEICCIAQLNNEHKLQLERNGEYY